MRLFVENNPDTGDAQPPWHTFAGTAPSIPSTVPYAKTQETGPFSSDAASDCLECGAPSGGFRAACLLIVGVFMLVCGVAVGFGCGIWWATHLMAGGTK